MVTVDEKYISLLRDVIDNGVWKNTRSGRVKSVFGRTLRFDLKEGFPLLTTKKVYTKGIIHELLWFISGDTNIKYLVDNNVHIWDDDAFRWFKTLDFKRIGRKEPYIDENDNKEHIDVIGYYKLDYRIFDLDEDIDCSYTLVKDNDFKNEEPIFIDEFIKTLTKDRFVELIKNNTSLHRYDIHAGRKVSDRIIYKFGDLGEVYGKQWRSFGISNRDQLQSIIDTLKTNPDDRRMVMTAWNPDVLEYIALPACHMFSTFWTRELSNEERINIWFNKYSVNKNTFTNKSNEEIIEILDKDNIPSRELSCSFTCRSQDLFLGTPFNWGSYALLTHLIAHCVNMTVGELIYNGLDCHIYECHMDAVKEQITRDPKKYKSPKLFLNPEKKNIDDFVFDDIKIDDYQSYSTLKAPLSVG